LNIETSGVVVIDRTNKYGGAKRSQHEGVVIPSSFSLSNIQVLYSVALPLRHIFLQQLSDK
jgi:hypothetical protein